MPCLPCPPAQGWGRRRATAWLTTLPGCSAGVCRDKTQAHPSWRVLHCRLGRGPGLLTQALKGREEEKKEPELKPHHTCLWEWFTLTTGNTAHVRATLPASLRGATTSVWAELGQEPLGSEPGLQLRRQCHVFSSRTPGAAPDAWREQGLHTYTRAQSISFSPPLSEKKQYQSFQRSPLCATTFIRTSAWRGPYLLQVPPFQS